MLTIDSLDKSVFEKGLQTIDKRVDGRYFATALPFAQELANIIGQGILAAPGAPKAEETEEDAHTSPSKGNFNDARERRKLGKRILKATQPFLENALKREAEITNKSYGGLVQELENIIENGLDASYKSEDVHAADGEDTVMADAPQITSRQVNGDDAMDTTEDGKPGDESQDSTEMDAAHETSTTGRKTTRRGAGSEGTAKHPGPGRSGPGGPPTPPQSNGSFGKEPADPLTEGGLLWYFKGFDLQGTSIAGSGKKVSVKGEDPSEEDAADEEVVSDEGDEGNNTSSPSKAKASKGANAKRSSNRRR